MMVCDQVGMMCDEVGMVCDEVGWWMMRWVVCV